MRSRPLLALLVGSVLSLGILELGFRLGGPRRPTGGSAKVFDAVALRRYREELNAHGYHDGEWSYRKGRTLWRVVVLGDSFTEGRQVPREETFTERVEASLNEQLGGPPRYQLCNVAQGGWGTVNQLQVLEAMLADGAELDAVLVVYFINDATSLEANTELVAELGRELADRDGILNRMSHAFDWLDWRLARRRVTGATLASYRRSFLGDERAQAQWRRSKNALARMKELADEHELRFGVVLFPVLAELDGAHGLRDLYDMVGEHCAELGVPFESLLDAFRGEDALALWLSRQNAHPNARGHAIAAEAIEAFLIRQGLVPPP